MHDRRRHRALTKIAAIRNAQRSVARHELFLAGEREREAQAGRQRAGQAILTAAAAWEEQLGDGFHPELSRALGGELMARVDAGAAADAHAREMTGERETSEAAWRLGDARCRQADQAHADSRRAATRDREEQALTVLADRISFAWSRA